MNRVRALMGSLLSQAVPNRLRRRGRRLTTSVPTRFQLPVDGATPEIFARHSYDLLGQQGTLIYFDTSFLMWMVRIGKTARAQLIDWLEEVAGDRLHVPVWSAHELYRHHADRTIPKELKDVLSKLEGSAKQAFNLVWPLLSEPMGGAPSAQSQRSNARTALSEIQGFVEHAGKWSSTYDVHAVEVMEFVNRHALEGSDVFSRLDRVETQATARFTGRVPPGFQDRNKTERRQGTGAKGEADTEDAGDDYFIGSNKWGDLMFWQEILDHAAQQRAAAVVILTRDLKNDWQMAGTLPARGDAVGDGVVPPHPMLTYEAACFAGICDLVLLDQHRVASMLDILGLGGADFISAAQPPPQVQAKSQAEVRTEVAQKEMAARAEVRAVVAQRDGCLFCDRTGLEVSLGKLRRALVETTGDRCTNVPRVVELAEELETAVAAGQSLEAVFTEEAIADLDHIGLTALSRYLGLTALTRPALEPLVTEFAALLGRLPEKTASSLYLGFLLSMYLDADTNAFIFPPRSCAALELFRCQGLKFAALPIEVLQWKALKADRVPIYLPEATTPEIRVQFEVDAERAEANSLRALWIDDHQLLTESQGNAALQLTARFARVPATPELLLDHVAEIYTLPRSQLRPVSNVTTGFAFDEFLGFKEPDAIFAIPAEEEKP